MLPKCGIYAYNKRILYQGDCAYFQNVIIKENDVYVADIDGAAVAFMAIKFGISPPEPDVLLEWKR